MQDRFKFRVWDKTNNKYIDLHDFQKGEIEFNFDPDTQTIWIEYDKSKYDIQQCTGLKDKNGTLIYEGYIVKSDFEFVTIALNPLSFNRGTVIYSDYTSGFMVASDISDFSPYKNARFGKTEALNCKVIGNIYENADLLEEDK